MTEIQSSLWIALGANLPGADGPPERTLVAALAALGAAGLRIRAVSRFYATPCFPAGAGPDYVNAAVAAETDLAPAAVLARLHGIEARFGRVRAERWGMRTLDLDLLAVADLVCPDAESWARWAALDPQAQRRLAPDRLILPHPRLAERAFVLVPLADIAPGWCHPVTGQSVAAMLAALPPQEIRAVRPI